MEGWHLMSELLLYDPERRLTAREALAHPYLNTSKQVSDAECNDSKNSHIEN